MMIFPLLLRSNKPLVPAASLAHWLRVSQHVREHFRLYMVQLFPIRPPPPLSRHPFSFDRAVPDPGVAVLPSPAACSSP